MAESLDIWIGLGFLLGLVWLVRLGAMRRVFRKRLVLTSRSKVSLPEEHPRISIIVAAKDEEDNIETCIRTLLAQTYRNYEVIAVDDRSDDKTPQILRSLRREYGERLKVIHIKQLREGWFGKNNAMREGVEAATGDWFCFTDADCRYDSPDTLTIALSDALENHVDFLSVTPVLETRCWWERVIQPVCASVLIVWFLPERVNKRHTKTAYANGAFMLLHRSCYDGVGGHDSVKTEVNEDIHMARAAKQRGYKLRVVENEDLYNTRMYTSLSQALKGWSRIFYGSLGSPLRLSIAATVVFFSSVLPWIGFALSLGFWLTDQGAAREGWWIASMVWGAVGLTQLIVMSMVYSIIRIGSLWALTYPLGCATVICILFSALLKSLGASKTTWRGTTYLKDQLADGEKSESSDEVIVGSVKESSANA
ncbi:MAG: glycosyltransferase family 2 protein [Planctomycetota bacterium]|jgi:glycosyltransferase involved in cell wall biosynthesis